MNEMESSASRFARQLDRDRRTERSLLAKELLVLGLLAVLVLLRGVFL